MVVINSLDKFIENSFSETIENNIKDIVEKQREISELRKESDYLDSIYEQLR